MRPLIPLADVTVFGALDPDGEVHHRCRVTSIGKPASAVLYARMLGEDRWKAIDRLTEAAVTERPDGSIVFEGISQELVNVVGVPASNATVRWEVRPLGCRNCN